MLCAGPLFVYSSIFAFLTVGVKGIIEFPPGNIGAKMLYYVLIGLCFSLVGVAGLQLTYLFYLDRIDRERKKRLSELEHRCADLRSKLRAAHMMIEEQKERIENLEVLNSRNEEVWADVLEEN
jgi:hypothetical protein